MFVKTAFLKLHLFKDIYIFKNNHSKHLLGKRLSKLF